MNKYQNMNKSPHMILEQNPEIFLIFNDGSIHF